MRAAERYASSAQHTPNPFLYEFYREKTNAERLIPTEHIGVIFESVLARSKPGEIVRLSVESVASSDELAVEILIVGPGESPTRIDFQAPSKGALRLGRRVAGVTIDAEETVVELGVGDQLEIVAPVFIVAKGLGLLCNQIVVKADTQSEEGVVVLEAEELSADPGLPAPIIRSGAQLQVTWPDAATYPWTQFAAPAAKEENPRTADALRALRRLAMAFRSHSKGRLARFKGKIEHQRMMKGSIGEAILRQLVSDKVITLEGPMYYLDADALGAKVGASYGDVNLKRYSDRTREYVQAAIGG